MKINEIILIDSRSERISVSLTARIDENGDLIFDGCDYGEFIKEQSGDYDYEYSLTVKAEYRDTILLNLIKDRFETYSEFKAWLDAKHIPAEFWSF